MSGYYPNAETYLNEEIRRPIKYYLKGVDEKTVKKVMSYVDYLCDKYREMNFGAKFYEDTGLVDVTKISVLDYSNYIETHVKPVDYDSLDHKWTDEEMEIMLSDMDENEELLEELNASVEELLEKLKEN